MTKKKMPQTIEECNAEMERTQKKSSSMRTKARCLTVMAHFYTLLTGVCAPCGAYSPDG